MIGRRGFITGLVWWLVYALVSVWALAVVICAVMLPVVLLRLVTGWW